jgi:hypothetical protein
MKASRGQTLLIVFLSLSLVHCGSSEESPTDCEAPAIEGTPFGDTGTSTLVGTGTLPEGIPNGLDLQLMLGSGTFSVGVLPDDLFAESHTCGRTVHYSISQISSGTYTLEFEIYDPASEELDPMFEGSATEAFTIADGQTLHFDATFQ